MRNRGLWAALGLVVLSALPAALVPAEALAQSIYRCTDTKGQAVFQQAPCPKGTGGRVEVPPINTVDSMPAGEAISRMEADRNARIRSAQASGQLVEGMSTLEMQQVLGAPVVVNTDVIGGVTRQQHVYRYRDGSARYVYTRDGLVDGLQERPAPVPMATRPCYSELDIRNAGVGVNSVTLPREERLRRSRQVEDMRRCVR
jgi:hypothetical protein